MDKNTPIYKGVDICGHVLKLNAEIDSQASSGNSGPPPSEIAGFIPVILAGVRYKIPIYND